MIMAWTILGSQDEASFFDDHVRAIIAQERDPLPPREQRIGHVLTRWDRVGANSAFIRAVGGTVDDRVLARAVIAAQLAAHGYREASYDFDAFHKTADWDDVMAKAKRLIQSGAVKLLRNGYQNVVGYVKGDHGEYQPEIFRQDPNSRSITGSDCQCDWGEFQNQPRTRQWKKFQDRPCSHILALYWTSLATPLDEDTMPGGGAGGAGAGGTPTFPPGTEGFPGEQGQPGQQQALLQMEPTDVGGGQTPTFRLGPMAPRGLVGPDQMSLLSPGAGAPQESAQVVPGPTPRDVLPQFPMEGLAQGQINPASIPGARGPSPTNPTNFPAGPGGAFSSVRRGDEAFTGQLPLQNGDLVQLRYDDTGTLVGRSEAHGAGKETPIKAGQVGEVRGTDPRTGMVEVLYMGSPWDQNSYLEPYGATAWHFPSYLIPRPDMRKPGPAIRRPVG